MFENGQKRIIVAGIAIAVLAAGGYGVYQLMNPKQQAVSVEHSGHSSGSSAVAGDKVTLDAKARQLAGVQTAKAEKKGLTKDIRTTGKLMVNETGKAYLTSRIMGRIDELYINTDGVYVAPGQAIASVYSPDLIAAQEEYLLALETVQKLKNISPEMNQTNAKLLQSANRKLELLGVTSGDIEHLQHTRKVNDHMTIRAQFGGTITEKMVLPGAYVMAGERLFSVTDLSTVWLYADVYERDIASIQTGQEVTVTTPAYPGQAFSGVISFISPVLDDATRTTKVRVELGNRDGKLKPNMFANVAIKSPLNETLVVPTSSIIDTGLRKIVFIAQDDSTFIKRDIVVGQESNGLIQVLSGLIDGDIVVTQAAFLIDSQTQLGAYNSHAGHGSGSKSSIPSPSVQQAGQIPANTKQPASAPAKVNEHSGHSGH